MKVEAHLIDAALVRLLDQLQTCRAAIGWCVEVPPSDPEAERVPDVLGGVRGCLEDAAEAVYDAFEAALRAGRDRAGAMAPAERAGALVAAAFREEMRDDDPRD